MNISTISFPGEYPYTRESNRPCIEVGYGLCGNNAGMPQPRNQTGVIDFYSTRANWFIGCLWSSHPNWLWRRWPDRRRRGRKVGVSISSLDNMLALFRDIPLGKVSTSMTIMHPLPFYGYVIAVARKQGQKPINYEAQSKPIFLRNILHAVIHLPPVSSCD